MSAAFAWPAGRARRALIVSAVLVVALGLAAALASWWAVGTEPGARWAFEQLGSTLPGELKVEKLRGSVRRSLVAENLSYTSEGMVLTVRRLALRWSLRRVLQKRIDIQALDADGVSVMLLPGPARPAQPDSTLPELPDVDLPMDFYVKSARVHDVVVHHIDADTTLVIDSLSLAAAAFTDSIRIGALSVRGPSFDVDVRGSGRTAGRYAIDLQGDWVFRAFRGDDLAGSGRVVGNLDTLRLVQKISRPFEADVDAVAFRPLRSLRLDGHVVFQNLQPSRLDPDWTDVRASGDVRLAGRWDAFTSTGAVRATFGRQTLEGVYDLARDGDRVRLHRVEITRPFEPGRVVTQGVVVLEPGGPRLDLRGNWTALALPSHRSTALESPQGTFRMGGPWRRYRLVVDAELAPLDLPPGRWHLDGTGNERGITFGALRGSVLRGEVAGRGRIDWASSMGWSLDLTARGLDPSVRWPELPGSVGFDLATHGVARPGGLVGDASVRGLTGTLRQHPIAGTADVGFAPGAYDVRALDVGWGPNRLTASGEAGRSWNMVASLDAHDLSVPVPDGAGSLKADMTFTGGRSDPRLRATATGDSLRWRTYGAQRLTGEADVDLDGGPGSRLVLDATGGYAGDQALQRGSLRAEGSLPDHTVELAIVRQVDSLIAGGHGGVVHRQWRGRLTRFDVAAPDVGAWSLDSTGATVVASASEAVLENMCLRSGSARACGDFAWRRQGPWTLGASLEQVPLTVLRPKLPLDVTLVGPLDGRVDARGGQGAIYGQAQLTAGPGEVVFSNGQDRLRFEPATLNARADGGSMLFEAAATFPDAGTVRANLRASSGPMTARPIDGSLQVRLTDLRIIQAFVRDVTRTNGRLDADLALAGTTARPRWSGNARLQGATAEIPRLGIVLNDVGLTAQGDQSGRLALNGSARSGPGRVDVRGEASLSADGTPVANVTIKGDRFQASNTPSLQVFVTPDLRAHVRGDSIRLEGKLEVPQAEVHQIPAQQPVVKPSEDAVVVGGAKGERRRDIELSAAVDVTLGQGVHVHASGLEANPRGEVLVLDEPGAPTTARGELYLDRGGRYAAYGQRLEIERGRMLFEGGRIENPNLDVRAVRRARDGVVAGLEVRGTLQAPTFQVFSTPPMSERDALGYIVLGRQLERANKAEESIVTDAASSLGLSGGSLLAGKLVSQFGIDEASLQTTAGLDQATLMLGTYLSPRVFVNYGIGILDAVSTLRIQYFLNSKLTLEAETGSETSAGLLYTVER